MSKSVYERSALTTQIVGGLAIVAALLLAGAIIYSRPPDNQTEADEQENPVSQETPSSLNEPAPVASVAPTAAALEPSPSPTFFGAPTLTAVAALGTPAPTTSIEPSPSPTFFGAPTLTAIAALRTTAPAASVEPNPSPTLTTIAALETPTPAAVLLPATPTGELRYDAPGETELVEEHKLRDLFPSTLLDDDQRLSASGVFYSDGYYYIVFDNLTPVAKIAENLTLNAEIHQLINRQGEMVNEDETASYEDITFNENEQRFYVLIEALLDDDGFYKAKVEEYTAEFDYLNSYWLPFWFESANKGFEGLAYVRRGENDYLLALCEGNNCRDGGAGRTPGNGRIQIFRKEGETWLHEGTLNIPPTVRFEDYAGLAIKDNRVAVVSQASGQIWIGTLQDTTWGFVENDDTQSTQPTIYRFPDQTEAVYCNAEGISWITSTQIVVVSDRTQKDQSYVCWPKDQSIHIFNLP